MKKNMKPALIIVTIVLTCSGVNALEQDELVYDDKNKRDPFWPLVTPSGTITTYETDLWVSDMNLEGIILGEGGNNLAIINGKILEKGHRIGQYTIDEISDTSVILLKGEEQSILKLKRED